MSSIWLSFQTYGEFVLPPASWTYGNVLLPESHHFVVLLSKGSFYQAWVGPSVVCLFPSCPTIPKVQSSPCSKSMKFFAWSSRSSCIFLTIHRRPLGSEVVHSYVSFEYLEVVSLSLKASPPAIGHRLLLEDGYYTCISLILRCRSIVCCSWLHFIYDINLQFILLEAMIYFILIIGMPALERKFVKNQISI